jgi:NAD(P)-dependent dehydrogenase (short-subunit alcohol dehydrogenase family)
MSGVLDGRIAVITGGSTGIGLATATRFVAEGASVVIAGRRQSELDKAVANLGRSVTAVTADVSDPGDLDGLYQRVGDLHGHIDIVFANAAIADARGIGEYTEESVDRQLAVNIKGLALTVQKALPLIADGGSVIVTSSSDGLKGGPGRSIYAATKAAGRNLVRSWIQELKGRDIRVNAVSPGPVETPGLAGLAAGQGQDVDEFSGQLAGQMPGGRNITPEEVAAAVTFLASDDASGINGCDLHVDAGLTQI